MLVSSAPVDSPFPLLFPLLLRAHKHRTAMLSLPSVSFHHAVAGDAPPATLSLPSVSFHHCHRRASLPCTTPPYSPLSDAVWHGEHVGALRFAGDLAVGEFRSCRAVVPLRPLFSLAGVRAPFVSRRCCEGTGDGLRRSGPCARTVVGRLSRSGWPSNV